MARNAWNGIIFLVSLRDTQLLTNFSNSTTTRLVLGGNKKRRKKKKEGRKKKRIVTKRNYQKRFVRLAKSLSDQASNSIPIRKLKSRAFNCSSFPTLEDGAEGLADVPFIFNAARFISERGLAPWTATI